MKTGQVIIMCIRTIIACFHKNDFSSPYFRSYITIGITTMSIFILCIHYGEYSRLLMGYLLFSGLTILVFFLKYSNNYFEFSTLHFKNNIYYCSGRICEKYITQNIIILFFLLYIGGIDFGRDFLDVFMFLRTGVCLRPVRGARDQRKILGWDRRWIPRKEEIRNH